MKLPRGVSAVRVIRALEHLGYGVIRQKGSHVRLRHEGPPVDTVAVPPAQRAENRTHHGILSEVARMGSISIESLLKSV